MPISNKAISRMDQFSLGLFFLRGHNNRSKLPYHFLPASASDQIFVSSSETGTRAGKNIADVEQSRGSSLDRRGRSRCSTGPYADRVRGETTKCEGEEQRSTAFRRLDTGGGTTNESKGVELGCVELLF